MAFMVIFRTDGKPGYHQADELEGALRFVEHLRNNEGVDNAKVYRLDEVPIEVRTVYKVELAKAAGEEPEPQASDEQAEAGGDDDDREPAGAGARRSIFR